MRNRYTISQLQVNHKTSFEFCVIKRWQLITSVMIEEGHVHFFPLRRAGIVTWYAPLHLLGVEQLHLTSPDINIKKELRRVCASPYCITTNSQTLCVEKRKENEKLVGTNIGTNIGKTRRSSPFYWWPHFAAASVVLPRSLVQHRGIITYMWRNPSPSDSGKVFTAAAGAV